jgi:ceramide glucosyltransferase
LVDQLLEIAALVLSCLALVGSAYVVFGGMRARALFAAAAPTAATHGAAPAVTILKPLHRDEPGLEAALATVFDQDYPGEVQVVFGLQDPADPALAVARRLAAAHPGRDVCVVVDSRQHGTNRKVSNLINMAAQARHELIVLADSDIDAPRDWLRRVLAPLGRPEVGVVTCAYYGIGRTGVWSRLAAMDLSYRFLPSVAVGVTLGLARPCMGSTIALRRETLSRIGGFEAFADRLADDYAIGESVRRAGFRSLVAPVLVGHGCAESDLAELVAHELRWARTVRGVDPAGFAGSLVTHPLALALLGVLFMRGAPPALAILAVALICRAWMIRQVEKVAAPIPGAWRLFPARDMLSLIVFVGSFFVRVVHWRGARFRVDARGDLSGV